MSRNENRCKKILIGGWNQSRKAFFGLVGVALQAFLYRQVLAQKITITEATHTFTSQCILGEGAFWDSNRQKLWLVDIEGKRFRLFGPETKSDISFATSTRVGTLVPAYPENKVVLGLEDGVYEYDLEKQTSTKLGTNKKLIPGLRLNDGKCDPSGQLWVGSMALNEKRKAGQLFRCDKNGKMTVMLDSVSISNGIAWTRNGKTMYYIDTPTRKVQAFDYEDSTGKIRNRRVAFSIPDSLGFPDGMTIDQNDNLWIAMWGGGCVTQWNPTSGKLLGMVKVPVPNVTSCTFGGSRMDILYITTARKGLKDKDLLKYPQSGDIFEATPGVRGFQQPYYKLKM